MQRQVEEGTRMVGGAKEEDGAEDGDEVDELDRATTANGSGGHHLINQNVHFYFFVFLLLSKF